MGGIILEGVDYVVEKFGVDVRVAQTCESSTSDFHGHRRLADDKNIFVNNGVPNVVEEFGLKIIFAEIAEARAINFTGDVEGIKSGLGINFEDMSALREKIFVEGGINMKFDDAPGSKDSFFIGIVEGGEEFGNFIDACKRREFVGIFGELANFFSRANKNDAVVIFDEFAEKIFGDAFRHEFSPACVVNVGEFFKREIVVEGNIRTVNQQGQSN